MVCQWRVKDTVAFMESRFKEHAEKEAQTSILKKFGRLLTNLFIGIVVLMMVGPTVYEIYEKQINPDGGAGPKVRNFESPDEARMRAEERDQ